jgi:prevent-host-death family protein
MYKYNEVQSAMQILPFSEARAHLAEALRNMELAQEPVLISRRGQAAGVLVPVAQYERLTGSAVGQAQGFSARLAQWRVQHADEDMAHQDTFAPDRDPSQGREFSW